MSFAYSILLKLLYPTSIALLLLLLALALHRRRALSRWCIGLAIAVLMVCGNGWVIERLGKPLEWRYLAPDPIPKADAIVVLGGGIVPQLPPRRTIEIGEAGDRMLYGAHLYRSGHAPLVICTAGVATGGVRPRPGADDMADLMLDLGVPAKAMLRETESGNTYQHARNLRPIFEEKGIQRVLLVTSALHMPRSLGVFQKNCPGIEFIPAPTDFRFVEKPPVPWYRKLVGFLPTPASLLLFNEISHEYLGMAYYGVRGWS